jgi:hypothetical protein
MMTIGDGDPHHLEQLHLALRLVLPQDDLLRQYTLTVSA